MKRTKEEELWLILIHFFYNDYHLYYTSKYIAKLLFESGFTDWEHIEKVFLNEVYPVCIWPALYAFGADFDENKIIMRIRCYKINMFYRVLVKLATCLISSKVFDENLIEVKYHLRQKVLSIVN